MDQPEVPGGPPHAERADAARNRRHLLATARQMPAGQGLGAAPPDRPIAYGRARAAP